MVPLTPASELRDDPAWIEEMLPLFEESCMNDEGERLHDETVQIVPTLFWLMPTCHFELLIAGHFMHSRLPPRHELNSLPCNLMSFNFDLFYQTA